MLVIDDDADIRDALAMTLEVEGYAVAKATNGREGLDMADSMRPDLLLLDLMMPVMDGWQVLAAMRESPALDSIPVLVMTAFSDPPDGVPAILKPFRVEELLATMDSVIGVAARGVP